MTMLTRLMTWVRWKHVRAVLILLPLLVGAVVTLRFAAAAFNPNQGPGGPILVVTSPSATFGTFYTEILRNEGLNAFSVSDISAITSGTLAGHDVVILPKMSLSSAQVSMFTTWVNAGGQLIAMAPDPQLASLLGITPTGSTVSDRYLLVDNSNSVGNGIVNQTMQFHGAANLYSLNGAASLATLYSSATLATANPAVTLNSVGANGGQAAAFAYDLATSIVYTRQGNPGWAAQERDGFAPIRSDDKFFGNAAADPQPDWIDLSKLAIPQADEQQRLLVQLITNMNLNKRPLPRFWYFPNGKKAVVIMTGDDHGNGGTAARFDQFKASSPAGCSVANWECVRGTSYIYTTTPLTNAQAAAYTTDGFEVGLHINTNCGDFTPASLEAFYTTQIADWVGKYTSVPAPITQRHHCIAWSDWITGAQVQLNHGIRLDTSYYFWPPGWVNNTPGLFTGSAMPMRFANLDGTLVDVYNAVTQMTDESGQTYPFTPAALLDRALGPEGYYGAYTVNAHTDIAQSSVADAVVTSALARGVPVVSSRQMLDWLDARNGSSFSTLAWNGNSLTFTLTPGSGANGLQAMVPMRSINGVLSGITRNGSTVNFVVSATKGTQYASFLAVAGSYTATYVIDTTSPTITTQSPTNGASGVNVATTVTATFSEAADPATISTSTFELRDATNTLVPAVVTYNATTLIATLTPTSALAGSATYTATIKGGVSDPRVKDLAGNALGANVIWSFTTAAGPTCPCSGWSSSTIPTNPSVADPSAVELGVKFRTDISGLITGIRFYKGSGNTGTHVGNLWTAAGQLLATATFTSESTSGWQQVNFAAPVAIAANTVYVASYFAPNGNYAGDNSYFANSGVDNGVVHLLRDGVNGGNGIYAYGASSTFPNSTFQASNYWVDVVFTLSGPDTTPPTLTTTSPANGANGVNSGTTVTAVFSEAMDAATINTNTFELRNATNVVVPATVTYNAATLTATLTPTSALTASASYTANVKGGGTDPRVKDLAGNALAANVNWSFTTAVNPCGSPNPIVAENCLPGNPSSEWDISGAGDSTVQGFATQISANKGETVSFKVSTNASSYRFDIYRMGYYGGMGARKIATVLPSATLPQSQPSCLTNATTGLIDCGNWAVSGSWAIPANAVSGIYFAKLVRADTGGASHIVFIVRDDASTSDLLFQTSDTTWQAYNNYGGNSLYTGAPAGRAYKVSYNRPFNTRAVDGGQDWLFNSEYPMVRWLEANGYNVSYSTGVDSDRVGALIRNHKVFLSIGHDEYWSGGQRANVEAARNAGVHLAFLSGNEVFWKTRWENSTDASATPYRTLVSYKETHANAKIDPDPTWTGTWRDPRFSPPSDGGRPENALTGTIFMVNDGATTSIVVPAADGKMRLWRNTSVATLAAGSSATLPNGTLGYEWDVDADNGFRPAGLIRMSTTTVPGAPVLQDFGSNYASGTATHSLTLYKHNSGALVFGAGTVQWQWGLDATHDRAGAPTDARMQQATVNLLADMGTQPGTLQSGLVSASVTTDTTAPTSAITSPVGGTNVQQSSTVTITGTAVDAGGGVVGGVEVSVDGGTTWHPASGRASWTYSWIPSTLGSVTIKSRAADDSGNIEVPGTGVTVTVVLSIPQTCPCSVWSSTTTPTVASDPDTAAVELGVKFRSDVSGFITGIRFYKGAANTGTHIGNLWSIGGQQLATATFSGETASGWQQVSFASPVAITANTVYVASYRAPIGRYAADSFYFASSGANNGVLHLLQDGVSGGNGVYAYSGTSTFPSATFQATNYWVDVVFTTGAVDTTPPTVTAQAPTNGATGISTATAVTAVFSEAMDPATINSTTLELRTLANVLVPATVTYNSATRTATLAPSSLLASATAYTATIRGGATDPRVKDAAGNALAANSTWSFTTVSVDTTPPAVPTGLTATATTSGVLTSWVANTEIDLAGYNVYRSASATGPFTLLNATRLTSLTYDDSLAPNGTSFYAVTAVDTVGNESVLSSLVNATMAKTNRLVNPGFELDANNDTRPDSWTTATQVTRSNLVARSGTYAMRHFSTANAGYTLTQVVTGLTAATSYTFAGWTNIPSTSDAFSLTLRIRWRNAANTILRTDTVKAYSASTAGWDKATASFVTPAGTTNAQVQMVVTSLNATLYVDDFALR